MQRFQTPLMCAGGAVLASLLSFGPAQEDPNKVLSALRKQIAELEEKVETCEQFMQQQAAAGKDLGEALARSEAEGFTAGINPRSREILLEGLRTQAKAMQSGEAEAKKDDRRSRSRQSRRRDR